MSTPSLFARYTKEREGFETVEDEFGMATYKINEEDKSVYIKELYVVPEHRHDDHAQKYANKVCEIARSRGCKALLGTVDVRANKPEESMAALIFYGMRPYRAEGEIVYWVKEL